MISLGPIRLNILVFAVFSVEKYDSFFCQVKAVWDDISTPFRAYVSGITWKDLKTLQKGMPDLHESLMVSIFAPSVTWKSGWLNDAVFRVSKIGTF